MIHRLLLLFLSLMLIIACTSDDDLLLPPSLPTNPELECNENSLVGEWYVLDSITTIYHELDSTSLRFDYREIDTYADGSGYDYFYNGSEFTWELQCSTDTFTVYNNGFVTAYHITSNRLNYKRLKRVYYNPGIKKDFYITRELFKKQ